MCSSGCHAFAVLAAAEAWRFFNDSQYIRGRSSCHWLGSLLFVPKFRAEPMGIVIWQQGAGTCEVHAGRSFEPFDRQLHQLSPPWSRGSVVQVPESTRALAARQMRLLLERVRWAQELHRARIRKVSTRLDGGSDGQGSHGVK